MKKILFLKASILFLAIASFHLLSIPHAFDTAHHFKAVADQQEMHEMKAGQNVDDKKSLTGSFILTALFAASVSLMVISDRKRPASRRRQRKKSFLIAKFYQSSYFDKLHVQHRLSM
ncbi:hypothetical protein ACW5MY_19665 (plasmid) [Bacillus sp. Bwzl_19]